MIAALDNQGKNTSVTIKTVVGNLPVAKKANKGNGTDNFLDQGEFATLATKHGWDKSSAQAFAACAQSSAFACTTLNDVMRCVFQLPFFF